MIKNLLFGVLLVVCGCSQEISTSQPSIQSVQVIAPIKSSNQIKNEEWIRQQLENAELLEAANQYKVYKYSYGFNVISVINLNENFCGKTINYGRGAVIAPIGYDGHIIWNKTIFVYGLNDVYSGRNYKGPLRMMKTGSPFEYESLSGELKIIPWYSLYAPRK